MKCCECGEETINAFVQMCEKCIVKSIVGSKEFMRTHKLVSIEKNKYKFRKLKSGEVQKEEP